ncbi:MAG: hypothetical protein IJJ43_02310 [Oscillospiraceae bacterium]|nr:hypothetical protein [Oscillospiraceae bacterium]
MKKAWGVILVIVFSAILLGAVCVGVGYITGADMNRILSVVEDSSLYAYVQTLQQYWNQAYAYAMQLLASL